MNTEQDILNEDMEVEEQTDETRDSSKERSKLIVGTTFKRHLIGPLFNKLSCL